MILGEPSHTYIGSSPMGNASKVIHEDIHAAMKWEREYRPYLKPHQ